MSLLVKICLVVVVILFVISLFKKALKFALFLFILGVIAVVFFGVKPEEVIQKGVETTKVAKEIVDHSALAALTNEVKDAKYTANEDGGYTLTTGNVTLVEDANQNISLTYKGMTYNTTRDQLSNVVQQFIEAQQQVEQVTQ